MKTIIINADTDSSAKLFFELAKKLRLPVRILSDRKKDDAALLALMEERKNDATEPIQKTYDLLKKVK